MTQPSATRIVASVTVTTRADVSAARAAFDLEPDADLVELRADLWRESAEQLTEAIRMVGRPVVATVRPRAEGGAFPGTEDERRPLLVAAGRAAEYVDIEARASFAARSFAPASKIVSHHDFDGVPADLESEFAKLRTAVPDAAILKLAVTPRSLADVARIVACARAPARDGPPRALIAMGPYGRVLRALAGKLGCALAFGHLDRHAATAPGQWSVGELARLLRVREQGASTPVLAVVGNPIEHSLSPLLHNELLRAAGLPHAFVPLLADRLDEALALSAALDLRGLSVTLPFKADALLAACGAAKGFPWPPPEGAVNTLLPRDGGGYLAANTDRIGFLAALELHAPVSRWRGREVLVLGAGGAARTCTAVLTEAGARVSIASRTRAPECDLARDFGASALAIESIAAGNGHRFELIVNATPVGMYPAIDASPLPEAALHRSQVVLDLIYRPRKTRLLELATRVGAVAIGGLEMFLAQALAQYRLFTGREPDAALARATLDAHLRE